jgi:HAD superfamily hydrolase (TIGR01457 family)
MHKLSEKRLFLLDMDGTIYLGDNLFDGTLDFLRRVRETGGRYLFLTNNSSRGTDSYIAKMARLGIETTAEDFLTSADAAILYLRKTGPQLRYYVCGTESLKRQLRAAGLLVAGGTEDADAVLLGYDTELTYQKLENCCILLNRGLPYIATHPDLVCPTPYGYVPDCGSVIAMLKTATSRVPGAVIGKPQPEMALLAMEKFGFTKEETCLIGDRVYTDIACGVNAGVDTVFVLSGEGVESDLQKYGVHPTWMLPNIRAVLREMEKETRS